MNNLWLVRRRIGGGGGRFLATKIKPAVNLHRRRLTRWGWLWQDHWDYCIADRTVGVEPYPSSSRELYTQKKLLRRICANIVSKGHRFKRSLLRVDLTQFLKCTWFFVLWRLHLEAILWCTSVLLNCTSCFLDCFKYVHTTCIAVLFLF